MKRLLFIILCVLVGLNGSAQDVIRHTKRVYRPEARADSALLNVLDTILMVESREPDFKPNDFDFILCPYYDEDGAEYLHVEASGKCYADDAEYGILIHKGHRFFLWGGEIDNITITENKIPVDSVYFTVKPGVIFVDVLCDDSHRMWSFRRDGDKWIFDQRW